MNQDTLCRVLGVASALGARCPPVKAAAGQELPAKHDFLSLNN